MPKSSSEKKPPFPRKRVDRAPQYLAALTLAILISLGFFWFGNLPKETGHERTRKDIRVSDTLRFAQETEVRLTAMRDKLDAIEMIRGEMALEIDALSSEIHKLNDRIEEIDADDVMSPAEMTRIKETVVELENRVETLNTPIS